MKSNELSAFPSCEINCHFMVNLKTTNLRIPLVRCVSFWVHVSDWAWQCPLVCSEQWRALWHTGRNSCRARPSTMAPPPALLQLPQGPPWWHKPPPPPPPCQPANHVTQAGSHNALPSSQLCGSNSIRIFPHFMLNLSILSCVTCCMILCHGWESVLYLSGACADWDYNLGMIKVYIIQIKLSCREQIQWSSFPCIQQSRRIS